MSTTHAAAIEIDGVSKSFGKVAAVADVSLQVAEGEFFSLLGPSGCGKTTLLRMMAGLEFPDSGTIRLRGADVTWVPPNKRPVNMVFQSYELFPHMTVFENVAYGLKQKKVPRQEIRSRVTAMLGIVGVGGLEARAANQLSGGQQQRVALARALVNRPAVLLLDEPLSALDVKLRKRMQLELKSIQAELGTTFVYVTHDQEEALLMSDRIGIMRTGRLLQLGAPRHVYERPADPFVAEFVGTLNDFTIRVDEVDGHLAVMRLGEGQQVRVPVAPVPAVGSELRAAIRPERLDVSTSALADTRNTRLDATVREVIYLGPTTQYLLETAVGRLVAQVVSDDRAASVAPGQHLAVTWPEDAAFTLQDDDNGDE